MARLNWHFVFADKNQKCNSQTNMHLYNIFNVYLILMGRIHLCKGLQRNGKSCRLRWINYLRPGLKRGKFSKQEEETILTLHHMLGNK